MKTIKLFLVLAIFAITFSSCTNDDTVVDPSATAYANADAVNGGKMFDKFWRADAGFDQSNTNLTNLNDHSNFFRCKQCHGWDGLGNSGAYINRAPKTSRPNVAGIDLTEVQANDEPQEIFDAIKGDKDVDMRRDISFDLSTYDPATNNAEGDKMPYFSQLLTDAQIWDLVKFIKEGLSNVDLFYDATVTGTYPTGTWTPSNVGTNGNATNGAKLYTDNCASCHGADGTAITVEKGTVGAFVRQKGNEAQHKMKYGIEGHMPANALTDEQIKDIYKALSDATAYPDPA